MKTVFQTGPGLYSVQTGNSDASIPQGGVRAYCARIEVYDLDMAAGDGDVNLQLLAAMSEVHPGLAAALLRLGDAIEMNKKNLILQAKKDEA